MTNTNIPLKEMLNYRNDIERIIESFNALIGVVSASVDISKTPEGQFKIAVDTTNAAAIVSHSWNDKKWSYSNPNTIDVTLWDKEKKNSYLVYMTECQLEDFPELLTNAFNIVKLFFENKYEIQQPKRFSLVRSSYAYFDIEGAIYKYAQKTKRYIPLEN